MKGCALAPVFDSAELKVFVEENEGQMELTRLHAHFPDGGPGPITYTLQSGDQSTFSVDPISGKVLLLRALDAESEPGQLPPVHRLKVGTAEQHKPDQFVMEPGLAHSCEMTIHVVDINDWIPNFAQEKYEFKIAESATSGTIVGQVVAFDQDLTAPNNKIRYELLEQQQQSAAERRRQRNPFQIDTESGQIVVSDAEQLAHLAGQTVHLVAKAVDGGLEGTEQNGTAQVEIVVTEEMARTTMSAPAVTTTVATTTKKFGDEDDEASPTAAASPLAPSVKSRTTGSASEISAPIWTVHAPPLPPATIAAVQTASPQIQFVAHMFNASVAEGKRPPVLQTLEVHNKPRDTRFTICAIREGNVKGAFSVTPNLRGDCEVRTQMQLDRESVANYRMNVSIQNGVQTDSAIVAVSVLDINDNKPKFVDATTASSSSAASSFDTSFAVLSLETEANAQFFSLTARDADTVDSGNGAVSYALVDEQQMPSATVADGSDATFFGIDATTGKMFVRKKASEIAQLTRKDYFRVTMTKRKAISTIVGHGVNGTVTFTQATDKAPVVVEGTISGLKIGEVFGLHVHEFGNLSEHGMSAGGHFNPKNVAHGSRTDEIRHLGDLGNIYSDAFGVAKIGFVDDRVSLFGPDAILGRSLIVSKNRDDLGRGEGEATLLSKVTGNSGGFHAGGAILACQP